MSFPQNNFLTGATSDADVAVTEILETYFKKDGSVTMTGILNVGDNTVLGVKNIELDNQVSGAQPSVGKINLYSKTDKKLYMRDSDNNETDLTEGGLGDVVGPASSVINNLAIYPDNTGKVISDSLISKNNLAQATSNFVSNTLLRSDGAIKNIKDSVVSLNNAGVISGLTGLTSSGIIDLNTVTTFDLATTSNTANALSLQSSGGITATQRILNTTGTSADSILIDSTAGGIQLDSSSGVDVASGGFKVSSGSVDFTGTSSKNFGGGANIFSGNIDFNPVNTFDVSTINNSANVLSLQTGGGATASQRIWNTSGTSANSIKIDSTLGGIQFDSELGTNIASGGLSVSSGAVSFNTLNTFNAHTFVNSANAIDLQSSGGTTVSQLIKNNSGTSANSILIESTAGGIQLDSSTGTNIASGGLTVDNINVDDNEIISTGELLLKSTLNTDLTLIADGTGEIVINGAFLLYVNVDNQLRIDGNEVSSTITDTDLNLTGNGTGVVRILGSQLKVDELYQLTPSGTTETVIINSAGELGSTAISSGLPTGYLSGFEQVNTSTSIMTFGTTGESSKCRDIDDSFDLQWGTDTETINTATTGPGGITDSQDPVSANQGYQVYIIGDSTLSNSTDILAIEVDTDITTVLEFTSSDYDVYRLIGWFRTEDGSTAIEPHIMSGKALHREFVYTGNRGDHQILSGGSSTTFIVMNEGGTGSEDYTAPNSSTYTCRTSFGNPANSTDKAEIRLGGSTLTGSQINYTISNGTPLGTGELTQGQLTIGLNKTTRQTEYRVDDAVDNLYVYIISFRFHL